MGSQGGKALKWLPAHFNFERRNAPKFRKRAAKHFEGLPAVLLLFRECGHNFETLCPQVGAQDDGRGLSYTPSLPLKPDLRLRLHATQAQPCFPAASNALALPGGNGIFTATQTERIITHYTLLRKVVCQGASPFGNPRQQNRRYATPPRGAYRLFLLSSSPAISVEQKSAWDRCGIFI